MAKEKTNIGPQGIKRHDYSRAKGYFVRYRREGAQFNKLFSDGVYGSSEAALEAAKLFYKELVEAFPPMNRREFVEIKRRNNKSGIVGVWRQINNSKGYEYPAWHAWWSPRKGVYKHTSFAVSKHGEEGAKQLAIAKRAKGLREMELNWPEGYKELLEQQSEFNEKEAIFRSKAIENDIYAFEGDEAFITHRARERDRELRNKKIETFYAEHGDIFCELCGFSFEEFYGVMGIGLIEVHHVVPLAEYKAGDITRLEDLMLVCSNCHFVIHAGNAENNLEKMKRLLSAKVKTKNKM